MNPNQTTYNTAFVLYVLSCVEFFGLRSALRRRLRLFFFGFDPIDMSDRSGGQSPDQGSTAVYTMQYVDAGSDQEYARYGGDGDAGSDLPIAADLADAWGRCVQLVERAHALGLSSHNTRVPDLYAWWADTNRGDLRLIWRMPDKAQREISASVVSLAVWAFERRVSNSTHEDAGRRLVNWRSVCDPNAGRWVTAVPWDRHGHLNVNNTAYRVSFARRYRLGRPMGLRGVSGEARGFDGDHDECADPQRQWTKTLVHNEHRVLDGWSASIPHCRHKQCVEQAIHSRAEIVSIRKHQAVHSGGSTIVLVAVATATASNFSHLISRCRIASSQSA